MPIVTLNAPGREPIQSSRTDCQAFEVVSQIPNQTDFITSLVQAYRRGFMTTPRIYWLHRLANEAAGGPDGQPAAANTQAALPAVNLAGIFSLFTMALQSGLRRPAITINRPEGAEIGRIKITFTTMGQNGGTLSISDGGPYGANKWYGRIKADGSFVRGQRCTPQVLEYLTRLAADPGGVIGAAGRRTSSCCFCSRPLTDDRDGFSVQVGYGPICAQRWGLPHGSAALTAEGRANWQANLAQLQEQRRQEAANRLERMRLQAEETNRLRLEAIERNRLEQERQDREMACFADY